jgi:hypothetical protein
MPERRPSEVFDLLVEKMRDGYCSDAYFVYTKATLEREQCTRRARPASVSRRRRLGWARGDGLLAGLDPAAGR